MRSPIDRNTNLLQREIEPGLKVWYCPKSGGLWIPTGAYWDWYHQRGHVATPLPEGYTPRPVDDSERPALFCPESGCLMARFKVGHGLEFQVDRSPVTGGVWLDAGEWEALKSAGLHDSLHLIFTGPYQRRLRTEETDRALAHTLERLIGAEDFQRVSDFRAWMTSHRHSSEIFAFLHDAQVRVLPPERVEEEEAGAVEEP